MKTRIKVWAFKFANFLLNKSIGLELATVGMNSEEDRITMLIYTTPALRAKALTAAAGIADEAQGGVVHDVSETVH